MKLKRMVHTLLAALSILLVAACTTNEPEVIADCFWSATAVAYLDANENGTFDEGEAPLEGVEFILEPSVLSRTVSGSDGSAYIFATTPLSSSDTSCEELTAENPLQVIAVKHDGYRLTTPQMLDYTTEGVEYHFGFIPETAAAP